MRYLAFSFLVFLSVDAMAGGKQTETSSKENKVTSMFSSPEVRSCVIQLISTEKYPTVYAQFNAIKIEVLTQNTKKITKISLNGRVLTEDGTVVGQMDFKTHGFSIEVERNKKTILCKQSNPAGIVFKPSEVIESGNLQSLNLMYDPSVARCLVQKQLGGIDIIEGRRILNPDYIHSNGKPYSTIYYEFSGMDSVLEFGILRGFGAAYDKTTNKLAFADCE